MAPDVQNWERMRTIVVLALVLLTSGAVGCSKTEVRQLADGGPFCPVPVGDCSMLPAGSPGPGTSYCTLSSGISRACMPCEGDGGCTLVTGIVEGTKYTYLSILNVDVGTLLAYDKTTGSLVAIIGFRPDLASCAAGPANFDATEALETGFSLASQQALRQMCDAATPDGGADAAGS